MVKKVIGYVLITVAGFSALIQWWQISYRLSLFFSESKMVFGITHIADGGFSLIYRLNGILFLIGLAGVLLLRFQKKRLVIFAPLALNTLGCLSFFIMHKSGILVEYMEAIGSLKGIK